MMTNASKRRSSHRQRFRGIISPSVARATAFAIIWPDFCTLFPPKTFSKGKHARTNAWCLQDRSEPVDCVIGMPPDKVEHHEKDAGLRRTPVCCTDSQRMHSI